MRKKKNQGFTLVELIVVVAILGFLLSIAIPRYLTARTTAAQAATKANLHQLASSMELYMTENPGVGSTYPAQASGGSGSNDDAVEWLQAYIPKAPVPPGGKNYKYQAFQKTSPNDTYAIWDPNPYGGKYFAAGPGGAIGEGASIKEAVNNATGLNETDDPTGEDLIW
ncbi:MAG: type II secretion system protein [Candidatus Caldatribacterium sp.]|nr:type II secretion system protein [Candidatus Caldatribacterium sp.]